MRWVRGGTARVVLRSEYHQLGAYSRPDLLIYQLAASFTFPITFYRMLFVFLFQLLRQSTAACSQK